MKGVLFAGLPVALLAVVATSRPAAAEEVGVVAVRPAHTPIALAELEEAVAAALRARNHVAVPAPARIARDRLIGGAVVAERLAGFTAAAERMREGWTRYANVEYAVARSRLAEARQQALALTDLAGGVELFAEVSLRLGVIKHELRDFEGAAGDFRLAQRLAPTRPVTIDHFKPDIVTAFQAAVASAVTRRTVSLRREPGNAAIEIDGRLIPEGVAHIDLEEGLHLVVGRRPGFRPERTLVRVERGTHEIGVALEPDAVSAPLFSGELSVGTAEGPATRKASALALFAELDAVLIAAAVWRGGQPALVGQWCDGDRLQCGRPVEIRFASARGLPAATTELVDRARAEERRFPLTVLDDARITDAEKRDDVVKPPPAPWWKNKWLWIGVGAGAVALGTTAAILAADSDLKIVIEADPCQFGGCP